MGLCRRSRIVSDVARGGFARRFNHVRIAKAITIRVCEEADCGHHIIVRIVNRTVAVVVDPIAGLDCIRVYVRILVVAVHVVWKAIVISIVWSDARIFWVGARIFWVNISAWTDTRIFRELIGAGGSQ